MLLIIALILVSIFIYLFKDTIKKFPVLFYIGTAVVAVLVYLLQSLDMPVFVQQNIIGLFSKGTLGTALFIVVMYTGALPNKSKLIAPLMRIRGELSIIACILVLIHNVTYGKTYYRALFKANSGISTTQIIAAYISIFIVVLMLILTFTSFKVIRSKFKPKKWKQLQRSAYLFYGLLYVHIMLINIPYARAGLVPYGINAVIYTIVFAVYAAMRIKKHYLLKQRLKNKDANDNTSKINTVVYIPAAILCVFVAFLCFTNTSKTTDKDNDIEYANTDTTKSDNAGNSSNKFKADGDYTGTAVCEVYGYTVTVTMTVENDVITAVNATSDATSQDISYFNKAVEKVPDAIVEKQAVAGVDTVAGATKSSSAIKKAFYNAYKFALN